MSRIIIFTFVAIGGGLLLWFTSFFLQKAGVANMGKFVRVPPWLAWLFGRPNKAYKLQSRGVWGQIQGTILVVGWIVVLLTQPEAIQNAALGPLILVSLFAGLPWFILIEIFGKNQ